MLIKPDTQLISLSFSVSVLSDTAVLLSDNKRELLQSKSSESRSDDNCKYSNDGGVSVLVTIDKHTFSTLPQRVTKYLHQYMDYIATIIPSRSDSMTFDNDHEDMTSSSNEYKLAIKDTLGTKGDVSFGFKIDQEELVWNV